MRSPRELNGGQEAPEYRELRLLQEVRRTPEISQRSLAHKVGIALGLTNVLLRNLAEKGYIRITRAGWRRWLYTLTPTGFSRKIRLTVAYIHRFLDQYQIVKGELGEELALLDLNEESHVAIYGTGEFAELVFMGLKSAGIEEVDVLAPVGGGKFLGVPVRDISQLRPDDYDRVLISRLDDGEQSRAELLNQGVPLDKVVILFADGRVPPMEKQSDGH